ncbi:GCN5-related N-acetyltransferase [Cystobacter fuscus DSM 2262]|uniref:GCN5-related N-acetyltransferase n=1 Tax=Cystobacter fuscus (strain ATCC 25194 / DSM 2262 / NBRC 100088 / M29) TaxID=1242864 RepID=S9PHF9_CYSF2|nr:N-acetyltransferase [Cystobacter fuscus]EPX63775.1 GCN5-related N-acetyltransferase [Cystobacter fuscus DSM 2262]
MRNEVLVRPELPHEAEAIRNVNARAFGRDAEAGLVDALRGAGGVTLSLVAWVGEQVVGHILFSPVEIDRGGGQDAAVGLGPMAVLPDHQRHGVGARLIRAGIDQLREAGHGAVVVLGHPDYYPRFGFARASRFGLRWEEECPDEAFMALELREGFLGTRPGIVRYRPEFSAV